MSVRKKVSVTWQIKVDKHRIAMKYVELIGQKQQGSTILGRCVWRKLTLHQTEVASNRCIHYQAPVIEKVVHWFRWNHQYVHPNREDIMKDFITPGVSGSVRW